MHFIFNALFLIAGWKWGDWKRWRAYYPTILFFICGDLLKNFLLYNYPMWTYEESILGESILSNHTFISLMIMFVVYPSTILIYLGRFPNTKGKQFFWYSLWVFIYSLTEYINYRYLSLIHHHNGWTIGWSILFNMIMFFMFWVHHKNPLVALAISAIWVIFLWNVFDVPVRTLR
jgi:hypothetical protein